jgi:RNA polymerase sigma-70 factor (ECF subfamily)
MKAAPRSPSGVLHGKAGRIRGNASKGADMKDEDRSDDFNSDDFNIEEWVNCALKGDPEAIAKLYHLYEGRLRAAIKERLGKKLRGQMDSADLIQSVWGDVLKDLDDFEYQGPESFFQWILVRLIHKIQDKGKHFSRKKRDLKRVKPIKTDFEFSGNEPLPPSPKRSPSQTAISKERLEKLTSILKLFPEHQQQVLILKIRDELEYEEIGKVIGKSADATRMIYKRSLQKLVEYMLQEKD